MARKATYVQAIEQVVEAVRSTMEMHWERFGGHGREYQTRYWLIDPILRALGWDLSNPGQVWIEYDTGNGVADYAFLPRDSEFPTVILEAKSIPVTDIWDDTEDEEDWDDEDDREPPDWAVANFLKRQGTQGSEEVLDDEGDWQYLDDEETEDYLGEFKSADINQLRRQCRGLNTGYGVLSCGSLWSIFDLSISGNPRSANGFLRKRIAHFSILSSPVEECAEHLKVLHRRNLR